MDVQISVGNYEAASTEMADENSRNFSILKGETS